MSNDTIKRYIISSGTTFLAAFFGTLAIAMKSGAFDFTHITGAMLFALLSVAVRAGFKAFVESFTVAHGDPVA